MKKNSEYVGVDEKFIPENEKYVDDSALGDKEKSKKVAKRIGIGYLCFFGVMLVIVISGFIFTATSMFKMNKQFEQQKDRVEQTQQKFDKEVEQQQDKLQQYQQQLEQMYNQGLKK